jgi:hypothetical protein
LVNIFNHVELKDNQIKVKLRLGRTNVIHIHTQFIQHFRPTSMKSLETFELADKDRMPYFILRKQTNKQTNKKQRKITYRRCVTTTLSL